MSILLPPPPRQGASKVQTEQWFEALYLKIMELVASSGAGMTELTGDVTAGPGTGAQAATIGAGKVTNAMLAGSIAASKLVGTDIATVGTITAGTWTGTKLSEAYGGTNQSTYTLGDLLYASALNTLSKLTGNTTTTKKFLRQTGDGVSSAAPAWDTLVAGDIPALSYVTSVAQTVPQHLSVSGSPITSSGTLALTAKAVYDAGNSSTAITLDFNNGAFQKVTLTGNCTFTLSNPVSGEHYTLLVYQDGTGGRTLAWPGTMKWENGITPTMTVAASKADVYRFVWDGTNYFVYAIGQNF